MACCGGDEGGESFGEVCVVSGKGEGWRMASFGDLFGCMVLIWSFLFLSVFEVFVFSCTMFFKKYRLFLNLEHRCIEKKLVR